MKKLFEKWFCHHNWEVHAKTESKRVWYDDYNNFSGSKIFITEVLFCKNCGKIKTIEY